MTAQLEGQLDLLVLLGQLEASETSQDRSSLTGWTYYETDPDKLDALHHRWVDGYQGVRWQDWKAFPGWHESMTGRNGMGGPHPSFTYTADPGCNHWRETTAEQRKRGSCQCVGRGMLYRVYCAGCDWWTPIHTGENQAAEAYLDHCWPGWNELPVLESKTKGYDYVFTFPGDYPGEWNSPGAPIKDCRGTTKFATRHVPGGSPFGGYKVAVVQACDGHR
ncbi:DUF6349 family protein [Arthrobacter luteolus]|uniref:DUF6349 family protein n=1 Tax=Arthrobacter luteolus TaxID=98672 RepID=UPI00082E5015|nr:DUF6349 family protein [Arthrobacter luteolus]